VYHKTINANLIYLKITKYSKIIWKLRPMSLG